MVCRWTLGASGGLSWQTGQSEDRSHKEGPYDDNIKAIYGRLVLVFDCPPVNPPPARGAIRDW